MLDGFRYGFLLFFPHLHQPTAPNSIIFPCPPPPQEWQCAEGFAGNASSSCQLREDCVGETMLSECLAVAVCSVPPLDPCAVASACPSTLAPGGSCERHGDIDRARKAVDGL